MTAASRQTEGSQAGFAFLCFHEQLFSVSLRCGICPLPTFEDKALSGDSYSDCGGVTLVLKALH